jgi:hypothetical protein
VGSAALRTEYDIWQRPQYAYGIISAVSLAQSLGLNSLSVIEFGVAGGNGLLEMERIARQVQHDFDVHIAVFGFDSGTGMPAPQDYRDLPYVWEQGFYAMEPGKLRSRLDTAELILGEVSETIPAFLARRVPPIGFIAFDLDYYSSTKKAFQVFRGAEETRLPRISCYFDDVIWPERACHNEFVGELCAIREFNDEHDKQKIAKHANLAWMRRHHAQWNEQIYVYHDFCHSLYSRLITPEGNSFRQLALSPR